jgi:peptidoglycan/xylan/chitin deacetylase (PgdA/CDA1 family)
MAASLPILTFHSLDSHSSVISFSPQLFRHGLARLRKQGHRAISLLEAVESIRNASPFPDHTFAITFDDGYESVYRDALPVLQDYNLPATLFITVGRERADRLPSLEGRAMLTWQQIREMHECGIDIGAHTLTHPDLTKLAPEQIEREIIDSKKIIEDRLGATVTCFAYPFGRYDRRSREIARRHFACACSDNLGITTPQSDPYALERVDAYYLRTQKTFDLMLSRSFPHYIWSRNVPRRLRRLLQAR